MFLNHHYSESGSSIWKRMLEHGPIPSARDGYQIPNKTSSGLQKLKALATSSQEIK